MTIEVNPKNAAALQKIDKVDPSIVEWVASLTTNQKVIDALKNPVKKALLNAAIKKL